MKKKVGRIEAIIIMKAAKEFREKQATITLETPEPIAVSEAIVEPIAPTPKSIFSYLIDFFR